MSHISQTAASGVGALLGPERTSVPWALEARRITFLRGRRTVLRDLDLAVAPGEIVALTGSNGAGKTTLLHCLAGLLRPAAGKVVWFGQGVGPSPAARRRVGYLGHESGLYPTLTARENLVFAGRMCGVDRPAQRAEQILSAVGLQRHARQWPGRLSRGMRQRLAIARAVLHDPPILLFDEPFTGLDADSCAWLAGYLAALRDNGRAIVLTSHDAERSRRLADRLLRLQAGCLHSTGAAPDGQSLPPVPGAGRA